MKNCQLAQLKVANWHNEIIKNVCISKKYRIFASLNFDAKIWILLMVIEIGL